MKDIINVKLKTQTVDFISYKTDILAVGLFSDAREFDKLNKELNKKLDGAFKRLMGLGDFKGKEGTNAVVYGNNKTGAKRILLVGLGEKKKATMDTVRNAAANAAKTSVELKAKTMSSALHAAFGRQFDLSAMARAIGVGTYSGSYRYDEFITENENGRLGSLTVELIDRFGENKRAQERTLNRDCHRQSPKLRPNAGKPAGQCDNTRQNSRRRKRFGTRIEETHLHRFR